MENYVVRFNEADREAVLGILSQSNDIIINHVEAGSAGITIQLDDADQAYNALLARIDQELHGVEVIIVKPVA